MHTTSEIPTEVLPRQRDADTLVLDMDQYQRPEPLSHRMHLVAQALIDKVFGGVATADIRRKAGHEEFYLKWPSILPMTAFRETHLFGPEGSNHEHGPNPNHPVFTGLRKGIETGNFRSAIESHHHIHQLLEEAVDTRTSWGRRLANQLVSDQHKREHYVPDMSGVLNHEVYEEVMAVPNMLHNPNYNPRTKVGEPRIADSRDWSAVLDLQNVQELRAYLIGHWIGNKTAEERAHARLASGAAFSLDGLAVASYLGVPFGDLREQIKKGEPEVVPPQVLAKLSFFLMYADDTLPLDNHGRPALSTRLAEFGAPIGRDRSPLQRIEESTRPAPAPGIKLVEVAPGVFEDPEAMAQIRAERAARVDSHPNTKPPSRTN